MQLLWPVTTTLIAVNCSPYAIGPLSVLSYVSVTLVYCCQTVGWIKMKLGMQASLSPGHIALDGSMVPLSQRRTPPPSFSAHICCCQMARWIKMPLGSKVGLYPQHCIRWGVPPQKRGQSPPNFRPLSTVHANGWMDQDSTWY